MASQEMCACQLRSFSVYHDDLEELHIVKLLAGSHGTSGGCVLEL